MANVIPPATGASFSGERGEAGLDLFQRQFHYTAKDFAKICDMIYRHAGIKLAETKKEMVYTRLTRRLRARDLQSFADYLLLVETDADEYQAFTNALTTNVTSFFREPHHFDQLAKHATEHAHAGPYRVWSAGCSSGEEPYSIAIQLSETLGPRGISYDIFASDIDTQVLRTAADAVYPMASVEKVDPARLKRVFLRGRGERDGLVRVRPEIGQHVSFASVNLLGDSWSLPHKFDAIFCRNVMIYFDKPTQKRLLERFAAHLQPHGLLFAGHAESLLDAGNLFRLCGRTVYSLVRPS